MLHDDAIALSEEALARDGRLRLQLEAKLAELAEKLGVEPEQLREGAE